MNIGEKIKTLRCSKMLTQQELAGDYITRNMLSRIENGFALPSVPTLVYLAKKLGVPTGYLLAGEEEEFHYKKKAGMPDILSAYHAGDWAICADLCSNLGGSDDEIKFISCICLYNEAKDHFDFGNLREAATLFDMFKKVSADVIYPINHLVGQSDTYLLCISTISTSLVADIEIVSCQPLSALSDPFCRYFAQLNSLDSGEQLLYVTRKPADEKFSVFDDHLSAKYKMKNGKYAEAYMILKRLLSSDFSVPAPMLYFIFTDLEVCCRELSDYRGAYGYSADRTGMLEKFLG